MKPKTSVRWLCVTPEDLEIIERGLDALSLTPAGEALLDRIRVLRGNVVLFPAQRRSRRTPKAACPDGQAQRKQAG